MTDDMTARSVQGLIGDPELIPPTLDLSRPELIEVMDRYRSRPVATPAFRQPVALIVRRPGLPSDPIQRALLAEGWAVQTCEGPGAATCPLMIGKPCGLRESADVAVVYVGKRGPSTGTDTLPRLRCASHPASPSLIAIEDSIQGPAYTTRAATVGGLRDPRTIIEVIGRLLVRVRNR